LCRPILTWHPMDEQHQQLSSILVPARFVSSSNYRAMIYKLVIAHVLRFVAYSIRDGRFFQGLKDSRRLRQIGPCGDESERQYPQAEQCTDSQPEAQTYSTAQRGGSEK